MISFQQMHETNKKVKGRRRKGEGGRLKKKKSKANRRKKKESNNETKKEPGFLPRVSLFTGAPHKYATSLEWKATRKRRLSLKEASPAGEYMRAASQCAYITLRTRRFIPFNLLTSMRRTRRYTRSGSPCVRRLLNAIGS